MSENRKFKETDLSLNLCAALLRYTRRERSATESSQCEQRLNPAHVEAVSSSIVVIGIGAVISIRHVNSEHGLNSSESGVVQTEFETTAWLSIQ